MGNNAVIRNDMTKGNPTKLILRFSIPLLIGNIFQLLYNMVDTFIVGKTIDYKALAAVGSTGAISFLIMGFALGLTSGCTVVTAQRFGAGDEEGMRRSIATSTILCIFFSIIMTLISVFAARPLLELMSTPDDIIDNAYTYIVIIFGGMSTCIFYNLISGIIRAIGDSRTPLIFLVISCIINIVFDVICIVPLKMGVAGAAVATVFAQFLSGLFCLIYALKKYPIIRVKKQEWKWDTRFAFEHLRIAVPMAFQFSVTAIGVMVIQSALNRLGTDTVAAHTAASRIISIIEQPLDSFGVTMATYAAQNFGAKKMERIKEGVRKCTIISLTVSIVGGLFLLIFGGYFVTFFIEDATPFIISRARIYMNTNAITFWILGLLFIYRNTLQGIGSSFVPMVAGICELVMRAAVAFTLAGLIGYAGVCLADPAAWIGATVPLMIKYFIEIKKLIPKNKNKTKLEVTETLDTEQKEPESVLE